MYVHIYIQRSSSGFRLPKPLKSIWLARELSSMHLQKVPCNVTEIGKNGVRKQATSHIAFLAPHGHSPLIKMPLC